MLVQRDSFSRQLFSSRVQDWLCWVTGETEDSKPLSPANVGKTNSGECNDAWASL